jgi:hypothetical protein
MCENGLLERQLLHGLLDDKILKVGIEEGLRPQ